MTEDKTDAIRKFNNFRKKMNEKIIKNGTLTTRRFFTLDSKAYQKGVLSVKTKELMGLVASMVLRCDDCITYHIIQCVLVGVSNDEFWETFDIALIVGGSIVIPHLRRAVDRLEECRNLAEEDLNELRAKAKDSPY